MELIRIGADDLPRMRELLAVFGEAFDEPETYCRRKPDDAWLRNLLSSEMFIALAALDQGQVVGGLAAYDLPKFESARREIYIYDLAVAASHRRRGIATGLIRQLQGIAAARGAWVIFVQADPVDEPAVALYGRLGTREDVLHFDIAPDGR